MLRIVFATILGIAAGSAWGQGDPPLAPAAPWKVEYHPEMCVLSRPYGTGAAQTIVGLRTGLSDEVVTIVVARPSGKGAKTREGKLVVLADGTPVGEPLEFTSRVAPASALRIETAALQRSALPALQAAPRLTLRFDDVPPVDVAWSGVAKALAALTTCERDLLESWGFDLAMRERVVTRPKSVGNMAAYFGANAYPPAARQAGREGRVVTVLTIGTDGRPTACRVAISSKTPALDDGTCTIARRLKYEPGRDAAGTAVAAQTYLSVLWQLES